ncbi:unnamed protein product [Cuscuta epithymum]|uniref:Reverse transcriptase zinc-binding domain-containing protein n=1 Tax=Cuscuta epithymum TaxID=186058 RepID=A0AAV0D8N1_9ASTE|nr:unnamed protein product [Cuscuta epithymum]
MGDLFKHNLPGVICWFIWKAYSAHIWGSNSIPLKENLIAQIKHHTQMWSASFSKLKRRKIEPYLLSEGLLTKNFRFGRPMFQIVRWIRPKGKDKLNVDASFLPGKSAGGVGRFTFRCELCLARMQNGKH